MQQTDDDDDEDDDDVMMTMSWSNLGEVIIPLDHCSVDDQTEQFLPLLHRILSKLIDTTDSHLISCVQLY